MRPIPAKLRQEMASDPYYKTCARKNAECNGRITWEHAWIYGGNQINEKWAIIPLCEYHHAVNSFQDGGDLDKKENQRISLSRATFDDLKKYPRKNWAQEKIRLGLKRPE